MIIEDYTGINYEELIPEATTAEIQLTPDILIDGLAVPSGFAIDTKTLADIVREDAETVADAYQQAQVGDEYVEEYDPLLQARNMDTGMVVDYIPLQDVPMVLLALYETCDSSDAKNLMLDMAKYALYVKLGSAFGYPLEIFD